MTTFSCIKCGLPWTMGATRDMNCSHACPKCLEAVLKELRHDLSLWKAGRSGGADMYNGYPPGFRLIDEVIKEE